MQNMIRCATVALAFLGFTTSYGDAIQWTEAEGGNGHWYEAIDVDGGFTAAEAQAFASSLGGYMVTLTSQAEDQWVYANLDGYGRWIGAFQNVHAGDYSEPSSGWRWMSGEAWGYTNWNGGGPDNNDISDGPNEEYAAYCCDGAWNDIYEIDFGCVVTRKQLIVEYDSAPNCPGDTNGDGAVNVEDLLAVIANWGSCP